MALELPGVTRIDTPAEARSYARKWSKMASELDTPDAPAQAKEHVRELRQRAKAAHDWARRQEDALTAGHAAGRAEEAKVTPIRGGTAEQQHGPVVKPGEPAGRHFASYAARESAHRAYHAARPPAMRIAARGRQHFFEGLSEPFGPVGGGWDLVMEAIGLSVVVILLYDLLRSPGAIDTTARRGLAGLDRLVSLKDPITGLAPAQAVPTGRARPARTPAPTATTGAGAG